MINSLLKHILDKRYLKNLSEGLVGIPSGKKSSREDIDQIETSIPSYAFSGDVGSSEFSKPFTAEFDPEIKTSKPEVIYPTSTTNLRLKNIKPRSLQTTYDPFAISPIPGSPFDPSAPESPTFIGTMEKPIFVQSSDVPETGVDVKATEPFKVPERKPPSWFTRTKDALPSVALSPETKEKLANFAFGVPSLSPEIENTVMRDNSIAKLISRNDPNTPYLKGKFPKTVSDLGTLMFADMLANEVLKDPMSRLLKPMGVTDPRYVEALTAIPAFYSSAYLAPAVKETARLIGPGRYAAALAAGAEKGMEGLVGFGNPYFTGLMASYPLLSVLAQDAPSAVVPAYKKATMSPKEYDAWLNDWEDVTSSVARREERLAQEEEKEKRAKEFAQRILRNRRLGLPSDYSGASIPIGR